MDALIANAIHDAKNGLNSLNGWIDEARRSVVGTDAVPALENAAQIATHVSAQLVELLALYRENEGTLRLAIDDHDLVDFCSELLAETHPPHGSLVQLSAETSAADRIGVWAFDAYQVKMVLSDALRNAYRHAASRVNFRIGFADGGGIQFFVNNDGSEFPAEIIAGDSPAMRAGGSGLGLAFAHLIAYRHTTPAGRHGHIELTNTSGPTPAAQFSLILP